MAQECSILQWRISWDQKHNMMACFTPKAGSTFLQALIAFTSGGENGSLSRHTLNGFWSYQHHQVQVRAKTNSKYYIVIFMHKAHYIHVHVLVQTNSGTSLRNFIITLRDLYHEHSNNTMFRS